MPITAAALRAVQIGRPRWGKKGYRTEDVDGFLVRAARALDSLAAGRTPGLTADDVHSAVFRKPPLGGGRGYAEDQVDALLDAVERALRA